MRVFCEIHETNYSSNEGCPLWSEHDTEHKASKKCLPATNHPLYKTIQTNKTLKGNKSNEHPR